ncbi:MAG: hypothetical protein ACJ78Q_09320 [Chloroflexia bacterium]
MLNGILERRPGLEVSTRTASEARASSASARIVPVAGSLLLILYILYFFLMQSHTLWQSPTLISDRWKPVFYPLIQALPYGWVRAPKFSELAAINSGLYLLLIGAVFAVYLYAVRRVFRPGAIRAGDVKEALAGVVIFLVGALLVLMVVPGVLSTDLFSYIWYGRIMVDFGQNPLTHVPADYTFYDKGGWLQWVFWKETPSVYGPAWLLVAGAIAQISNAMGGDIVNQILGHKLVAALAHLTNVALIWQISGMLIERYWRRPDLQALKLAEGDWKAGMRLAVTLAYAWNPLMVIEMGANGHNDVLMLTGVLLALWLHLTGRWRLAVAALAVAGLIKAAVIVFLPGYLWLLCWEAAREGAVGSKQSAVGNRKLVRAAHDLLPAFWRLAQAVAILGGIGLLFYIPFWEGPATLKPLISGPAQEYFVNSLADVLRWRVPEVIGDLAKMLGLQPQDFWSADAVGSRLEGPIRWGFTAITGAVALTQTWRARTFPGMLVAWGWTLFAYLTVGAVWFWPWYVSWLVIVAVLLGPGRLLSATQILCASSMALYGLYWQGGDEFVRDLMAWRPLVIMVPPLAYVIAAGLKAWRRSSVAPRIAASAPSPAVPVAVRVSLSPAPLRSRPSPEGTPGWDQAAFQGGEHQDGVTLE